MRAPLSWIREFTPVEASTEELVAALNQVGLEVEGVEEPGREVRGVIAARVLDVVKHPNADKLTLVDVDFGSDSTRVVCGAENVAAGDVVPYAPAGAHLPEPFGVLERGPRYLGRVAQVTMGPSPSWMAQRLVKAGMRPISNVVDVTNYVLLERNQPLHAFDLGRLAGRGILVRLAERGEHITTLDGVDRALTEEDLLICDADGSPQAIAGVMGGGTSEVSDTTSEVLLESAYFERMGIARTSKRLKLRSESSARFERGIDPNGVADHAERAIELFAEVAGARVAAEAVDEYPAPVERGHINLLTSQVNG